MANAIGSTFVAELRAAGVSDWRFSWDTATGDITFSDDMQADDPTQVALVLQVYAAHDPLNGAKADKITMLTATCAMLITSGATSDALGALHTYPTDLPQQINMTASVVDSLLQHPDGWTTPFMCRDSGDSWARREHTASQIQKAGSDLKAYIVTAQRKLDTLIEQVTAAQTQEELDAISWT